MIKFFQKIRQRLLSENKLSKYLLYAIGEIILVVIGILIALQINNWNDKRKFQKEKTHYIEALINDYVQDTINFTQTINAHNLEAKTLKVLNTRVYQPNANLDTIVAIAKDFNGVKFQEVSFFTNTFDSMESSGKLELFENDIKERIFSHNNTQKKISNYQYVANNVIIEKITLYTNSYKFANPSNQTESYLTNLTWTIENEREFVMLFTELIGLAHWNIENVVLNNLNQLLNETRAMITLLKEEQKI